MRSQLLWAAVALTCIAPTASGADHSYKSVMPDGSVRYGDAPEPGAKQVNKIPPPAQSAGIVLATPEDKEKARTVTDRLKGSGAGVLPRPKRIIPPAAQGGVFQAPPGLPETGY